MSICITNPEDKIKFEALAAIVGEETAIADMLRHDGLIRSPRAVIQDMQEQLLKPTQEEIVPDDVYDFDARQLSEEELVDALEATMNKQANENSMRAIQSFSARLGIEVRFIDNHPSIQAAGFYEKGVVTFIRGKMRPDTGFHEFAHPFVKSLHKDNPELFDRLYNDLINSPKGELIYSAIAREYKENYDKDSLPFQFEVMVTALTEANTEEIENRSPLGNILYAIKRFLRKIFGSKINLKNLSGKTKLKDLVEMLNLDEFNFDTDFLNMDDVIYLQKEYNVLAEQVDKNTLEKSQRLINNYANILTQQLNYLEKNQYLMTFMGEELAGDVRKGILRDMSLVLQQLKGTEVSGRNEFGVIVSEQVGELTAAATSVMSDEQRARMTNRINSFIQQVSRIETIMDILDTRIDDLSKSIDYNNEDQLKILFGIGEYIDSYSDFLNDVIDNASAYNQVFISKVSELLARINDRDNGMLTRVNTMRVDLLGDVLYEAFVSAKEAGFVFHKERLDYLEKYGTKSDYAAFYRDTYGVTPQEAEELEQLNKLSSLDERSRLRKDELTAKKRKGFVLTKEEFKAELLEQDKDAFGKAANRSLESFLYNQDTIIGTFYTWLKNNLNEVNANATARQGALLQGNKLDELIKAAGYTATRHTLSHQIGVELSDLTDVGGSVDVNGTVETNVERHYKSATIDHRREQKQLKHNVRVAHDAYIVTPNAVTKEAFYLAQKEYFYWQKENMNQDNVDAYYDAEELLWKDDIGIKAKMRLDDVMREISVLGSPLDSLDDEATNIARNLEFQKLIDLRSKLTADNKLKTGEELLIAERLQEHHKAISGFKTSVINEELFNTHYQSMMYQVAQAVDQHGQPISAVERQEMIDKWIDENTVVAVTEDYFQQRLMLQERRKALLAPITELNKKINDLDSLYEIVFELIRPTRDEKGQYNGKDLTIEQQILLRDTQQEIEVAKLDLYSSFNKGLSGEESLKFFDYWSRIASGEELVGEELDEYNFLLDTWQEGLRAFLSDDAIEELESVEKQLSEMSYVVFTDHYLGVFQTYYNDNAEFKEAYDNFLIDVFDATDIEDAVITDVALKELFKGYNSGYLDALLNADAEFKTFFNNNHISLQRAEEQPNGTLEIKDIYRNTAVWQFSQPASEDFLQAHPVMDINGNITGVLRDRNNTPRIPNFNYQVRSVKEEYLNEIVLRDYVDSSGNLVVRNMDNRGQWLPKETSKFRNQSYFDMFEKNRAKWELLNYIKNWNLDNQEKLPADKRKDIAFPKIRQRDVESITRKGYWARKIQRFKDLFGKVEDDYELGLYTGEPAGQSDRNLMDSMSRPLSGLYANLSVNEISADIFSTENLHMMAIEEYVGYAEMYETARTLEKLLNGVDGKGLINQQLKQLNGMAVLSKDNSQRAVALSKIMEREFQGIQLDASRLSTLQVTANKLLPGIQKRNSRKYFFLEVISALKNVGTQIFQTTYKWYDFRNYVTPIDTAKGVAKATRAIAEYQFMHYSDKMRTAQMQLMDILDASPDKFEQYAGNVGSRNLLKDFFTGKWGYYLRTTSTQHYYYHVMYAFMNNNKYRFKIDGVSYSLDQAVEVVNGRLQTIAGVPEEMSITYNEKGEVQYGAKINRLINNAQDYMQKVSGMSGKHGEGDAVRRNLLGKIVFSLKKFLPGMGMDRYEFKVKYDKAMPIHKRLRLQRRTNWMTGTAQYGTFIRTMDLAVAIVESGFTGFRKNRFSYEHYTGLMSTVTTILLTELIRLVLNNVLTFLVPTLGSGDDGEEYYTYRMSDTGGRLNPNTIKLLKQLPIADLPWISDSKTMGNFYIQNYINLQLARLLGGLENENESFYVKPLFLEFTNTITGQTAFFQGVPGVLHEIYDWHQAAVKETVNEKLERFQETGEPVFIQKSAYKRDPNYNASSKGPYIWQEQGDNAVFSIVSGYVGFKGYGVDPALGFEQDLRFKNRDIFDWSWTIGQQPERE